MKFALAIAMVLGGWVGGWAADDLAAIRQQGGWGPQYAYAGGRVFDFPLTVDPPAGALMDAPGATVNHDDPVPSWGVPPDPVPASTCGPKWLGGCWSYPNRSLTDAATDWHWWAPTLILTGATAFDYAMTAKGLADGPRPGCHEANPMIGQHPTAGTFAVDFAATHLPVIGLGLLIEKVAPKHSRKSWPNWIYTGMAAYGTAIHIHGGLSWMRCMKDGGAASSNFSIAR